MRGCNNTTIYLALLCVLIVIVIVVVRSIMKVFKCNPMNTERSLNLIFTITLTSFIIIILLFYIMIWTTSDLYCKFNALLDDLTDKKCNDSK